MLVLQPEYFKKYCNKCDEKYTDITRESCKPCQIKHLKNDFANWTSGNEKVDKFIQEIQINYDSNVVFEWIPYNRFSNIKKGKSDYTIYLVTWKNGPLYNKYNDSKMRESKEKVALKYFYNSEKIDQKILNEV